MALLEELVLIGYSKEEAQKLDEDSKFHHKRKKLQRINGFV